MKRSMLVRYREAPSVRGGCYRWDTHLRLLTRRKLFSRRETLVKMIPADDARAVATITSDDLWRDS